MTRRWATLSRHITQTGGMYWYSAFRHITCTSAGESVYRMAHFVTLSYKAVLFEKTEEGFRFNSEQCLIQKKAVRIKSYILVFVYNR